MSPWGVAETQLLGAFDVLKAAGAHELPLIQNGPVLQNIQDESPEGNPANTFYHPTAQQALIDAAVSAGATVEQGARVTGVTPGDPPTVSYTRDGETHEATARLVVGADGRTSLARKSLGREEHQHRANRLMGGVLVDGLDLDDRAGIFIIVPGLEVLSVIFPQGNGRARAYVGLADEKNDPFKGADGFQVFVDSSIAAGVPASAFTNCKPAGPLATFVADDSWVDHPYQDGVALIGDAAGISDPTWGLGLSLSFRDARVLRDCLVESDDWDAACNKYAQAHDEHYKTIVTAENWMTQILIEPGPEADARRARVLPLWFQEPDRQPKMATFGPSIDVSEQARRRAFGEDVDS